jgi:hypothetical protein
VRRSDGGAAVIAEALAMHGQLHEGGKNMEVGGSEVWHMLRGFFLLGFTAGSILRKFDF